MNFKAAARELERIDRSDYSSCDLPNCLHSDDAFLLDLLERRRVYDAQIHRVNDSTFVQPWFSPRDPNALPLTMFPSEPVDWLPASVAFDPTPTTPAPPSQAKQPRSGITGKQRWIGLPSRTKR